jgi:Ribosomal protein L16p/L10e
MNYQLFTRVCANIGVYTSGNEMRMGKGKGKFDYWAARVPVSTIVFELKGDLHEKVAREAFRLAGHKLPGTFNVRISSFYERLIKAFLGLWEFVKKGEPPVVGVTKLGNGVTLESLKRPRRAIPLNAQSSPPPPPSTFPDVPPAQ